VDELGRPLLLVGREAIEVAQDLFLVAASTIVSSFEAFRGPIVGLNSTREP
jgi:hypothetical protein